MIAWSHYQGFTREPTYGGPYTEQGISVAVLGAVAWLARPGPPVRYLGDTYDLDKAMEHNRAG